MNEQQINIDAIKIISNALEELNEQVVFVGGAVIALYVENAFADEIRPTEDIDIVLQIASHSELEELRVNLNKKGFKQSFEDNVVCRFNYKWIKVDIMVTKEIGWAPANKWFENGFKNIKKIEIDNIEIKILSLPYFIATKFEAFFNRGKDDARTSKDFEDIVYLLNHSEYLKEQISKTDLEVQQFLRASFQELLTNELYQEAIRAHLSFENEDDRYDFIMKLISSL